MRHSRVMHNNNEHNILVVMNSWVKKRGSFEDYMLSLAVSARERGCKISYIFPGIDTEEMRQELQNAGASIFLAGGEFGSPAALRKITSVIKSQKWNVVNFHFCDPYRFIPVFFGCRRKGIPIAFHYHGEIRPISTLSWKNRHLSMLRLASLFLNKIITVSCANAAFLRALHVSAPIKVVLNGIDVPRFTRQYAVASEGLLTVKQSSDSYCLYVGSLTQRKRVDMLLRAFSIARLHEPKAKLMIVGSGEQEVALKALASELGLDQQTVVFRGLLRDYPFHLLAACDMLVSASESESFGLVFVEAMAFKRPVIACEVGGIPEVVLDGETGRLVPPNQPEAFAKAIVDLLQDAARRKAMGEAAQKRVETHFQLTRCVAETLDAFQELF